MILAMGMDAAACLHGVRAAEKTVAKAAPIVGVWRAEMDGLPVFAMVITDEGGSLSGAIQFYLIRRNEGQPATATPGLPEPILNLHFDGKTLTFQVSHRRAHPPRTLKDPPVSFRLTLTGADKGEGENLSEASPVVVMTRSEY
jgi:hypothetical protein